MTTMLQEAVSCITLKVPHVLCDLTLLRNNGFLIQRICQFYESWRVPPFNRRTLQNLCRLKFSSQEAQHIESTTLVRTLSLPIQPMAIFSRMERDDCDVILRDETDDRYLNATSSFRALYR